MDLLEKLYQAYSKHFDNVILKPNRVWILAYGDLYVVRLTSKGVKVYRNWYNPYQLGFVALLDYLLIVIVLWLGHWHITGGAKFLAWIVLFIVSNIFSARNNKIQRALINKIIRIGQEVLGKSEKVANF